jgi:hypothetical protein
MFSTVVQTTLLSTEVTIQRRSPYPMPWKGDKSERPQNYYDAIKTIITYQVDGKTIEILIPPSIGDNRGRNLSVKVNGAWYRLSPNAARIMDMRITFDLLEMESLLALVSQTHTTTDKHTARACTPFFYTIEAKSTDPYIEALNGSLETLVTPYIRAMKKLNARGIKRELYIPIATHGYPHHWNAGILTLDERNKPSMIYLESGSFLLDCVNRFKTQVLGAINRVLTQEGYDTLDEKDILFDSSKQFSHRGCGFAASMNIEKRMLGHQSTTAKKIQTILDSPVASSTEYPRISIEEDALRRVQLAMRLTAHEKQVQNKAPYRAWSPILRAIRVHPHSLAQKASEAFPVTPEEVAQQIQEFIDNISRETEQHRKQVSTEYKEVCAISSNLIQALIDAKTAFIGSRDKAILKSTCQGIVSKAEQLKNNTTGLQPLELELLQSQCRGIIRKANQEFSQLCPSFWNRLHPYVKKFLGFLAIVTIIPASLVVMTTSYTEFKDLFFSNKSPSRVQVLNDSADLPFRPM